MTWLLGALTLFLLVDALRLRGRAAQLPVLLPTSEESAAAYGRLVRPLEVVPGATDSDHALLARAGVAVPPAVLADARAHAAAAGLDLVDLIPPGLSTAAAWALLRAVDPLRYRRQPFAPAASALHAALVSADLARRAGLPARDPAAAGADRAAGADSADAADPLAPPAFLRLVARGKRHAPRSAGLAVAPGLAAAPADPRHLRALLREAAGDGAPAWVVGSALLLALIVVGVVLAPAWGVAAAVAWHLSPALAVGRPLRPRDRWRTALLRLPLELRAWWLTLFGPPGGPEPGGEAGDAGDAAAAAAAHRAWYAAEQAAGPAAWFEPRREDCPQCGGRDLRRFLRAPDRFQHKPGRATLERCAACGTVFQNPRLNERGLAFYYADFYEGAGARATERLFASDPAKYDGRVAQVRPLAPRRWLDVGTGHGHFPCHAREALPETRFEGLDRSPSVEEGARQGWLDEAFRGTLPELAPRLAGRYDVVSLYHCLEHVPDPRAELRAARTLLAPGGHLVVEVPDPASRLGRLLRSWWLPWFQPQHLNLLPAERLEVVLREEGLQPVQWQRGAVHQPLDFAAAVSLVAHRLAPPSDRPWGRPPRGGSLRAAAVWTLALPFLALAALLDHALAPALRRPGWANAYRVLARRLEEPGAATGASSSGRTTAVSRPRQSEREPRGARATPMSGAGGVDGGREAAGSIVAAAAAALQKPPATAQGCEQARSARESRHRFDLGDHPDDPSTSSSTGDAADGGPP
jgi:SAM-dependent methyltransferase